MLEKSAPSNTFPSDGLKAADSQRLPSRQASGQNENADGTDLVNSPSTGKGHDLSEQMHKTRKKRTLKDLVRACGKLGDMSDKSQLLAQWKLERKDIEWKAHPANVRLRKMIHELVLKLEQLDRDLQTQGGASGKVRDVARERYWEADAPLTSMENPLQEDAPVTKWTSLQVESWALYLESQILFASLGVRISACVEFYTEEEVADREAVQFWVSIIQRLDRRTSPHNLGSASDIIDAYFGDDLDASSDVSDSDSDSIISNSFDNCPFLRFAGYRLSPDVKIPIERLASRMRVELTRMSKAPGGNARAFQLALMLQLDVLGAPRAIALSWMVKASNMHTFLLDQLSFEQEQRYLEHPLDCAWAFLYINAFIAAESHNFYATPEVDILCRFESLLDPILSLVMRDIRREYRHNLVLAFGQRLPAEIYEVILDQLEDVHNLPKNQADYRKVLHRGNSDVGRVL